MKKSLVPFLCAAAILLSACAGQPAPASSGNASSAPASSSFIEEVSSEADASSQEKTYSIAEFVALSKESIDAMQENFSDQGIALEVSAEGDSLVYRCRYPFAVGDADDAKASLEAAFTEQDAVFAEILTAVRSYVPNAASVIVEYLDGDGLAIFFREYR